MKRTIHVDLGDAERRVGILHYEAVGSRERSAFVYENAWLEDADRFAFEPGLPLVAGPQFHRKTREGSVFHAAIADTAPDGWARRVILRDHAKRRQEARRAGLESDAVHLNEMDFLLAVDDFSRVGASDTEWTGENAGGRTHPVGSKPPGPNGLHDMKGNVLEWGWDQDASHVNSMADYRVNGVGYFFEKPEVIKKSGKGFYKDYTGVARSIIGFRVAKGKPK